ncbi:MAG: methyltransferase domain-containing protein [Oscillospiraceae bacterium]
MYNSFATFYDKLTSNISYEKRALYFKKLIEKHFGKAELVLDLACGTGGLSIELDKLGYDVTAVDISPEMLTIAMGKGSQTDKNILYLCQDMTKLDLYGTMDVAICALDSINHITSKKSVADAFKRLSLFITDNGLFIFDVNTIYKHQNILANNTFVYDTDMVFCVWQNSINEKDSSIIDINLDFFEEDDGVYYRSQESINERAYSVEELEKWLNDALFDVVEIYDEDSFDPPREDSQRLIFVAKRRERD